MSQIPEELKERARWEIEMFERPHANTSKKLLQRVEELEAHILSLTDRLEEHPILDSIDEIQDWHNRKPEGL